MIPKETTEELFIKSLEDLMKKKTFEKMGQSLFLWDWHKLTQAYA